MQPIEIQMIKAALTNSVSYTLEAQLRNSAIHHPLAE